MSKKKVHTSQNLGRKAHRHGIKKVNYNLKSTRGMNERYVATIRAARTAPNAKNFKARRNIWAKAQ